MADQWSPLDFLIDNSVLWLKYNNLTEASFIFRELPLSLGLSHFGEPREKITKIYVPDELKHLDDLNDIEHVNDLEKFLSSE